MSDHTKDILHIGLCASCTSGQRVDHPRGGIAYWKCLQSETDPRFDKFPATPVRKCAGYQPASDPQESPGSQ
ncbi:MAG: hypothetical protein COA73_09755 [Candidatus Hydrogenedentota bacterium]|nr:MAG: hypothetical protein COA73_09755 [Candidatus Hydrogenedentota bacterium]